MPEPALLRILIIEDNPDDGALLEHELRRAGVGAVCMPVPDERSFLAAISPAPDLILAGCRTPGFGALAALRLLRQRGHDVPVIVVISTLGDEDAVECLSEGASDYLRKDSLGRLGLAVRNAVEQARLRRQERGEHRLLQAVVDGAAAAIYVKDIEGRFLLVNRRFEALLGMHSGEIVGRHAAELYPQEVLEQLRPHELAALASRSAVEHEVRLGEGAGMRTYLSVCFPLADLDGAFHAVCGIATDISDAKRLEAQLRQAQKMEAVGQLAGSVAHDFNNLLTVILGYSQLLAGRLVDQPGLFHILDEVRKAGERAAALTRQLLAFSRNQVLLPQLVDLNAVVAEVETMLRRLIGENVELVITLRAQSGRAMVDPGQVEQVILNLALNARDAMSNGGALILETDDVELDAVYLQRHPYARAGPHVVIAVSDTGQGMDAETRSHIFEPFFTTKEKGKGTGLGLSTVYGIVRQSGGHIEVYSEPGQGSTFRVYFPRVVAVAARPAIPALVVAAPRAGSETILLLEDEESVRALVSHLLTSAGYTVLESGSSTDTVAVAERHPGPIHLVLSDVIMPGMSGPEVAARIVATRPETRVLFTSGYTANLVDRKSLRVAHFLEKPFTAAQVLTTVREVLDAPLPGGDARG
jgi:PAS domain S-box-containing protein